MGGVGFGDLPLIIRDWSCRFELWTLRRNQGIRLEMLSAVSTVAAEFYPAEAVLPGRFASQN